MPKFSSSSATFPQLLHQHSRAGSTRALASLIPVGRCPTHFRTMALPLVIAAPPFQKESDHGLKHVDLGTFRRVQSGERTSPAVWTQFSNWPPWTIPWISPSSMVTFRSGEKSSPKPRVGGSDQRRNWRMSARARRCGSLRSPAQPYALSGNLGGRRAYNATQAASHHRSEHATKTICLR